MRTKSDAEPLILVCAVALTRFLFRSHRLYDLDSVNFALALGRFDPRTHQPHPPGYFLYVLLGRLVDAALRNANETFVFVSIVASCGTVYYIYKIGFEWFGDREAIFAGLLFLFSPLAWFHGIVALTYSVEAFFSTLIGYLCWRMRGGGLGLVVMTGAVLGVSAGVRPSSLLFLGPLYLFSLRAAVCRVRLAGLAALLLTVTSWFVPMMWASGGFRVYFGALTSLWRSVPSHDTLLNSSPATSIARAFTIIFIYVLAFGTASIAPLVAAQRDRVDREKKLFTIVWVAPALLFFTFIFLKFVNSGYLLLLIAPTCVWLGRYLSEWYRSSLWSRTHKLTILGACALMNCFIFLDSPLYCSYRSVRTFEAELQQVRTALPLVGSAGDTLVVGFDSHFLGYRHAGYYLPEYTTVEYPEVKLVEGTRVFAMHNRDTALLGRLPSGKYQRFVLFPLPDGDSAYRQYLQKVIGLLPPGSLKTVRVGNEIFLVGPISSLSFLFPNTDSASQVYSR